MKSNQRCRPRFKNAGRVALLVIGVLAMMFLSSSSTAQTREPPEKKRRFPFGSLVAKFCPHPKAAKVALSKGDAKIRRLGELIYVEAESDAFEEGVELAFSSSGFREPFKPRKVRIEPEDVERESFRLIVLIPESWRPETDQEKLLGPRSKIRRKTTLYVNPPGSTVAVTSGNAKVSGGRVASTVHYVEASPADAADGIEVTISSPSCRTVVYLLDPRMFYEAGVADLALPPLKAKKKLQPPTKKPSSSIEK